MSESVLKKRVVYAGDVHTELMKAGWTPADAARLISNVPDVSRSSGDFESLHEEIAFQRERAEKAEKQLNAVLKDLDAVASAVENLAEFVDDEVYPIVDYTLYQSLREIVDSISIFEHGAESDGGNAND